MYRALTIFLIALGATGCAAVSAGPPTATFDTHAAMTGALNASSMAIWDITHAARSEQGGLDPALLSRVDWTKLESAARVLDSEARHMAEARAFQVGKHRDNLPGFASPAEIQRRIDRDPEQFRVLSQSLAEHTTSLAAAVEARNVKATGDLASSLTERCQACHTRYWQN